MSLARKERYVHNYRSILSSISATKRNLHTQCKGRPFSVLNKTKGGKVGCHCITSHMEKKIWTLQPLFFLLEYFLWHVVYSFKQSYEHTWVHPNNFNVFKDKQLSATSPTASSDKFRQNEISKCCKYFEHLASDTAVFWATCGDHVSRNK